MKSQKNQSLSHGQESATKAAEQLPRIRLGGRYRRSLYGNLLKISVKALFVRYAARWTDPHAQLLGPRWEELLPCDTPRPPERPRSRGHFEWPKMAATLCNQLDTILDSKTEPYLVSDTVKEFLKTLWPTAFTKLHHSQNLNLHFWDRVYRNTVGAQLIWTSHNDQENSSSCSSSRTASPEPAGSFGVSAQSSSEKSHYSCPMIAYISKKQLESVCNRPFSVKIAPRGAQNGPVTRPQALYARKLLPSNSDQDAYLVGIFLGMAQKQFYPPPPKTQTRGTKKHGLRMAPEQGIPPCPDFHDLKLRIITHDTEKKEFIIYTGNVTKGFLRNARCVV